MICIGIMGTLKCIWCKVAVYKLNSIHWVYFLKRKAYTFILYILYILPCCSNASLKVRLSCDCVSYHSCALVYHLELDLCFSGLGLCLHLSLLIFSCFELTKKLNFTPKSVFGFYKLMTCHSMNVLCPLQCLVCFFYDFFLY